MPAMTAPLTPLMDDVQSDRPSGPWSPPCAPGDVIQGKYRIEKLVGSGGMAWVFEATHLQLQHPVALKILRVDPNGDNTEALARFRREARAAASISGDSTARVMDVGALDDASPFLVMELLEGRDLDAVIQARTRLSVASAVSYVLQACEGIAETHAAGIVHRDLKPSNLFLTETSDGSVRVKLLDFGVSKFADPSGDGARVTATRALVGSPVYMSPEQMRGSQNIDTRTDIWSIGIILYELLGHGHSPFEAPTLPAICARVLDKEPPPLRKIRRDLPRALEAVVLRCLEKEPERRFRTVADLADALVPFGPPDSRARAHRVRRILDGASSDRQSAVEPRRRGSSWLFAGGVTAAALMGLAAILLEHPSYVQSTVSAAHGWTTSAVHRVEAEAVTMGVAPPSPSDAPLTAFVEPVAPSAEPAVRPAEPLPASPEPRASLVEAPAPAAYAPIVPAPSASATVEAAGPYPAQAAALDAGLAKAARARALHHASAAARPSKTYVLEPIPEPEPAPPIVVPPPVVKPRAAATAQPTEEPTPYDEAPTPDFGGRQ